MTAGVSWSMFNPYSLSDNSFVSHLLHLSNVTAHGTYINLHVVAPDTTEHMTTKTKNVLHIIVILTIPQLGTLSTEKVTVTKST